MKNNFQHNFIAFFDSFNTLPKLIMKYGSYILLIGISIINIIYINTTDYNTTQNCLYILQQFWSSLSTLVIGCTCVNFLLKRLEL